MMQREDFVMSNPEEKYASNFVKAEYMHCPEDDWAGLEYVPRKVQQWLKTRAAGRTVRREPIVTEHPLIRSHPVTGWKALFFNPGFVTKFVGIPKVESDVIIGYLNEVVATTQELHVRFQWNEDDVAFWDNRVTVSL